MATAPVELSRDQARRLVVRAQLLDAQRPGDVIEVAEQLGAVKIDPTATIAPAEHTILFSRIGGGYEPPMLSKAVEHDRLLFEYDGAFRPIGLLPLLRPAMRRFPEHPRPRAWLDANASFRADVLARLRAEGPLTSSDIPDTAEVTRAADGWYGNNQVPIMLELLQYAGEVAVVGRDGRRKRWDLAERVYPPDESELSDDDAERMLQERRLRAAGIAKQKSPWTPVGTASVPVTVEGSKWRWRADPEALAALDDESEGRVAFLNPYDPLLADRPRLTELFDFTYVLEQYKPKPQRRYGFFAHPILMDDRFVGMLNAEVDRDRNVLRVTALHEFTPWDPEEHELVAAELRDLAEWLGVEVVGDTGEPD